MHTTIAPPHTFELPYTAEDLDAAREQGLPVHEAQYQAVLDAEAAELRAEANVTRLREARLRPPGEVGTPAEVSAFIDQAEDEMARLPALAEVIARSCGQNPYTGEPYYTTADVIGWFARAIEMGAATPRVKAREVDDIFRGVRVPNARLRDAYEDRVQHEDAEGLLADLARSIGAEKDGKADSTYALRLLGIEMNSGQKRDDGSRGTGSLRLFITYDQAVAFADVLGLTYHDIGV